jgi:hypothetical protein
MNGVIRPPGITSFAGVRSGASTVAAEAEVQLRPYLVGDVDVQVFSIKAAVSSRVLRCVCSSS